MCVREPIHAWHWTDIIITLAFKPIEIEIHINFIVWRICISYTHERICSL